MDLYAAMKYATTPGSVVRISVEDRHDAAMQIAHALIDVRSLAPCHREKIVTLEIALDQMLRNLGVVNMNVTMVPSVTLEWAAAA